MEMQESKGWISSLNVEVCLVIGMQSSVHGTTWLPCTPITRHTSRLRLLIHLLLSCISTLQLLAPPPFGSSNPQLIVLLHPSASCSSTLPLLAPPFPTLWVLAPPPFILLLPNPKLFVLLQPSAFRMPDCNTLLPLRALCLPVSNARIHRYSGARQADFSIIPDSQAQCACC